ncbi:MAG: hypothetical protein WCX74_02925 [Candidatus Paceibacterota bacterium]
MKIEELFLKINKTQYEPKSHKEELKMLLMNNSYFKKKDNAWWKPDFLLPSASFSLAIIIFLGTIFLLPLSTTKKISPINEQETLYGRLSKNNNAAAYDYGNGIKKIEVVQENTRTMFLFNKKNILIGSQAKNK